MPHAKIATKQATFTLEQLHAELAGKIRESRKETTRLHKAMRHVEAVLKLLQPGYNVRPIAVRRRRQNPWFKRGTVLRRVLDVLRKAETPLTAREVTVRMVADHGVTNPPAKDIRSLAASVSSSLWNHRGKGVARHGEDFPPRWEITRP